MPLPELIVRVPLSKDVLQLVVDTLRERAGLLTSQSSVSKDPDFKEKCAKQSWALCNYADVLMMISNDDKLQDAVKYMASAKALRFYPRVEYMAINRMILALNALIPDLIEKKTDG